MILNGSRPGIAIIIISNTMKIKHAEIVNHIATPNNKYSFISKPCELATNFKVILRRQFLINTQLHHGYIRTWIHMSQYTPCTMIQPPTKIKTNNSRCKQLLYLMSKMSISWSWIVHLIKFFRKSSEIIDGPRMLHCCYQSSPGIPMSRNTQNRFWFCKSLSKRSEGFSEAIIFHCIHRTTMPKKK